MDTLAEYTAEFDRLSRKLEGALALVREQVHALAAAENSYRKAKGEAWVTCPTDDPGGPKEWSAARRAAWVDAKCADLRQHRDIAEGMVRAGMEAVKSRRTQISALQSLLGAHREEASFSRTVPQGA